MTTTASDTTIVKEITINVPAENIFAAITDPKQLPQWWGEPGKYQVTAMESDLRVGGRWKTTGTSADGTTFAVEGVYRLVDRPRLLEMTWNYDWEQGAAETVVRYELTETNGVTHLRVEHSGFGTKESRDNHNDGWDQVLSWMTAYVTKG